MIRRAAMLLLVCGGLACFLQRESAQGTLDPWHRAILNWLSGPGPAAPVVMVEMRRGDLPFESWPPAPLDYALIFERVVRRQPWAVSVDSLLAWPAVAALDAATLSERIALLPHGVLACTLQRGTTPTPADSPPAVVPLLVLPNVSGELSRLPDFSVAGQMPIDEVRGSKGIGFTRIEFGAEPVVGESSVTIPLLARRGKDVVPSLLLQTLMAWKGQGAGDITIELGRRIVVGDDLILPIDQSGGFAVFSHLSPVLRRAAAGSLLLDLEQDGKLLRSQPAETEALAAIQGALVVLGETGETTPRFRVGPGREWTETELLAQGLAAALTGRHVREVPSRWQWALWATVVAAGMALPACSRRWIIGFGLAGALLLVLWTITAFLLARWWMPPLPLLALWTVACVGSLLIAVPVVGQDPTSVSPVGESPPAQVGTALLTHPASEDEMLARTLIDEDSVPSGPSEFSAQPCAPPTLASNAMHSFAKSKRKRKPQKENPKSETNPNER